MFDYYADQFMTLPMHFMTFHGQESLKKVLDVSDSGRYLCILLADLTVQYLKVLSFEI